MWRRSVELFDVGEVEVEVLGDAMVHPAFLRDDFEWQATWPNGMAHGHTPEQAKAGVWCEDGEHRVPVVAERDRDHKRSYVTLACGHHEEIHVGREYDGPVIGWEEYCHQCADLCVKCNN